MRRWASSACARAFSIATAPLALSIAWRSSTMYSSEPSMLSNGVRRSDMALLPCGLSASAAVHSFLNVRFKG